MWFSEIISYMAARLKLNLHLAMSNFTWATVNNSIKSPWGVHFAAHKLKKKEAALHLVVYSREASWDSTSSKNDLSQSLPKLHDADLRGTKSWWADKQHACSLVYGRFY